MVNQNSFTKEEWKTLQFGALWIFAAFLENIGYNDKQIKEILTSQYLSVRNLMAAAIEQATAKQKELEIAVFFSVVIDTKRLLGAFAKDTRKPLAGLNQLSVILEQKAPEEAQEFRDALSKFVEGGSSLNARSISQRDETQNTVKRVRGARSPSARQSIPEFVPNPNEDYAEYIKNTRIFIMVAFKINKNQNIKAKATGKR